jgi:KaiC/GvpD/RAD55 family RecA-like ATPase
MQSLFNFGEPKMIQQYLQAGLSVIPITKGAKYPSVKWDIYQERIATPEEAATWTAPLGIVGGKVSGGLVCIDFDDKGSRFMPWMDLIQAGNSALALALVIQQTPSGGFHVVYRCTDVNIGNEKLAKMAAPKEDGKIDLIETRGEGGQFLAYPSDGYFLIQNDFLHIPTVKKESHEFLIDCARSFNQKVKGEKEPEKITANDFGLSPFDSFNEKNTPIDLLTSHGWTVEFERGEVIYLKRPGKKEKGISASWNHIPDRLYVFTTNTAFENEHIYKASAVYSILEHGGDFKAAAKALLEKGFGSRRKLSTETISHIDGTDDADIKTFKDLESSWLKLIQRKSKTDYGFESLNKMAKQFSEGEVFTIAARSGVGKTTLGLTLLKNISKSEGKKSLFFSLEMSGEMIYQRSGMMYLAKNYVTNYSVSDEDKTEMSINSMIQNQQQRKEIVEEFDSVLVVDRAKVSIDAMSNYLERARKKHGEINLIAIDYLGYIYDGNAGNNYEKVSRIAKGAKEFAKENHVRVILLAQTSRAGGDGFEPVRLNHLRDSGAIEESADYLLGMWASKAEPDRIHCEMLKNKWHSRGNKMDLQNIDLLFREVPVLEEKTEETKWTK